MWDGLGLTENSNKNNKNMENNSSNQFTPKQNFWSLIIGMLFAFLFVSGCLGTLSYKDTSRDKYKYELRKLELETKKDSIKLEMDKIKSEK